jgi:ATP-binding protein involved in chromosome partitioning
MYHKLNIPVVGIIENMSYFEDSQGIKNYIFGEGGARKLAAKKGIEFIGEIPININLRQSADNGQPIICSDLADDKICENFKSIANSIFPK